MVLLQGREHKPILVPANESVERVKVCFRENDEKVCFALTGEGETRHLQTGYYIGADWLRSGELAVQVQPKQNDPALSINHMGMLFACLKHPEVSSFVGDLYQIDFNAPFIALPRKDDLLTPLLVAHFAHLLQLVVRQGLKKGYNPVARELRGKVKGKIDVAQTLRQGQFRQRPLVTACYYEEFSTDIPENRLLKQALRFARRYLNNYPSYARDLEPLLGYCEPAFINVRDTEATHQTVAPAYNPLYRAYNDALRIGWLLLKRFGYSLVHVDTGQETTVKVPPHWIDMAKLFELYVLGLLYERFGNHRVLYGLEQARGHYGLPDFLLTGQEPWIIDAKYKPTYQSGWYEIDDIRQISGYARDKQVLTRLGIKSPTEQESTVVRCLIIYPDRVGAQSLAEVDGQATNAIPEIEEMSTFAIPDFMRFYKLAITLPHAAS